MCVCFSGVSIVTSFLSSKAIVAEGHDPEVFLFGVDEKLVSPSKAKAEEKVELKDSEMASPDPDMMDLVVKDDTEDQEEAAASLDEVKVRLQNACEGKSCL